MLKWASESEYFKSPCRYIISVDFQLVVQKSRRESAHARTLAGILNRKFRACANSRRDFWKSTVQRIAGGPIVSVYITKICFVLSWL